MPDFQKKNPITEKYAALKAEYPGTLLLIRNGHHYEAQGPDSERMIQIMGSWAFAWNLLDYYLPKLVRAGERVAVCDELANNAREGQPG